MRWILYTSTVRTIVSWTLCPVFQKGPSLVKKWVAQLHLLHMKLGNTPLVLCSPSRLIYPCLNPSKPVTFQTISVFAWPKVTCLGLILSMAYGISGTASLSPGLVTYVRICFGSLTTLGNFSTDKSYMNLWDVYFWPNMWTDLEKSYIPLCSDCQWNKSRTTKAPGPLHPLPIPDNCGDSVALNFIGPLPKDDGHNCILTMTHHLGLDYHLIWTDASAEDIVLLVFNNWYCGNGLPSDFVSDRDILFVSCFWKAFAKLTGVSLKMSSGYHQETNGSSEQTNKTVNQSICFHVSHNQKGWVCALPHIWFCITNTINASTGYSGFQLCLGWSPCVIPPIIPTSLPDNLRSAGSVAENVIIQLKMTSPMWRTTYFKQKQSKLHTWINCMVVRLYTDQVTRSC